MNPLRVSCQISANQREGEEKSNVIVNKHWKTRAKSNHAIPIIISSNQHFASIFSLDIFKFQRRSCKLSFSSRPAARTPGRACSQVNQPSPLDSTGALLQILSIRGKKNSKLYTNRKRFKIGYLSSMTNVRFTKLNRKHYSPFSFTVCTQICKFSQLCGPISSLPKEYQF